jgi:hypothetical protein
MTIHCDRAASGRMVSRVDLLNNALMDVVHFQKTSYVEVGRQLTWCTERDEKT